MSNFPENGSRPSSVPGPSERLTAFLADLRTEWARRGWVGVYTPLSEIMHMNRNRQENQACAWCMARGKVVRGGLLVCEACDRLDKWPKR